MRQSESGSLGERAAIQRLEFNIETSIGKPTQLSKTSTALDYD